MKNMTWADWLFVLFIVSVAFITTMSKCLAYDYGYDDRNYQYSHNEFARTMDRIRDQNNQIQRINSQPKRIYNYSQTSTPSRDYYNVRQNGNSIYLY